MARTIYRDVHTKEEFFYLLDKWTQQKYAGYRVGWFAFHGSRGGIHIDNKVLDLDTIAEEFAGRFTNRIIYFASCSTMRAREDHLREFCKATGARAVCGYTRVVDWFESAAFELLLLNELAYSSQTGRVPDRMRRKYGQLTDTLGFRMVGPDGLIGVE